MWCVPTPNAEYIAKMDDVLNVLARPYDKREPVVTVDERPVVLRGTSRPGRRMAPGRVAREDCEYVRHGTDEHRLHGRAEDWAPPDPRNAQPQGAAFHGRVAA